MGVRISLTDQIRGGLERLVVLGLRENATASPDRHRRSPT